MGQVTLPVLNRKGYSSVWENHWDTKLNYNQTNREDLFLKKFFKIFLKNWFSKTKMFFNSKFSFNKKKSNKFTRFYKFDILMSDPKEIKNYLNTFKNKKFTYNFSKIFLVRFQSWLLIYAYIYVPKVWIIRIKKKQPHFFNKNYINELYKYHTSKLNYLNKK